MPNCRLLKYSLKGAKVEEIERFNSYADLVKKHKNFKGTYQSFRRLFKIRKLSK